MPWVERDAGKVTTFPETGMTRGEAEALGAKKYSLRNAGTGFLFRMFLPAQEPQ